MPLTLAERLRQLGVTRGPGALKPPPLIAPPPPLDDGTRTLAALVSGVEWETAHGACFVVEHVHPAEHWHGAPLGAFLDAAPLAPHLAGPAREAALTQCDLTQAIFLDTETTGLGGAGTLAFLVGLGLFEAGADGQPVFRVLQFFLRHPDEEPALLAAVARVCAGRPVITFNGRSFDIPLLEGRYLIARAESPWRGLPHLDLLPPARRLWRRRVGSCALGALEMSILGVTRGADNAPGWLIPMLYNDYLLTGDAHAMPSVLHHNHLDVLSMVPLAAALCTAFAAPQAEHMPARDQLSVAEWQAAHGAADEAEQLYRAVLADARVRDAAVRADAWRGLGALLRRLERRAEAVEAWLALAACAPDDLAVRVELAKHYEWQARDYAEALVWARAALAQAGRTAQADLRHRVARIEKKVAATKKD